MNSELNELLKDNYIPTAVERKKAVLMYFLVWILLSLAKKKISTYEMYHLKQSTGWWASFFIMLIVFVFMFFIPYVKFIPVLLFMWMLFVWILFVKQAREWVYVVWEDKILLPFFSWFGWWIIEIFEIKQEDNKKNY